MNQLDVAVLFVDIFNGGEYFDEETISEFHVKVGKNKQDEFTFFINDKEKPTLELESGKLYKFILYDNEKFPFIITEVKSGNMDEHEKKGCIKCTSCNKTDTFFYRYNGPTWNLYYCCPGHPNMRGKLNNKQKSMDAGYIGRDPYPSLTQASSTKDFEKPEYHMKDSHTHKRVSGFVEDDDISQDDIINDVKNMSNTSKNNYNKKSISMDKTNKKIHKNTQQKSKLPEKVTRSANGKNNTKKVLESVKKYNAAKDKEGGPMKFKSAKNDRDSDESSLEDSYKDTSSEDSSSECVCSDDDQSDDSEYTTSSDSENYNEEESYSENDTETSELSSSEEESS